MVSADGSGILPGLDPDVRILYADYPRAVPRR